MTQQQADGNPMDELRHVQLLLKREVIFTEFQENEIKELNASLRSESTNVLVLQKLLLYLHMSSMAHPAKELPPNFFGSLVKDIQNTKNQPTPPPNGIVNVYNSAITKFRENRQALAKTCLILAQNSPQFIDQLTFSTIPGLFGYIWSAEAAATFVEFMKEIVSENQELAAKFARVIFALPPFKQFFDAVMSELIIKVPAINSPESANEFCEEFIQKWTSNAAFCPNIVKEVINDASDKPKFLLDSFIIPAFQSPLAFGIVPISLRVDEASTRFIVDALTSNIGRLWQILEETTNSASFPSAEKLTNILFDLGTSSYFSNSDLEILIALVDTANSNKLLELQKITDNADYKLDEYCVYSFSQPSIMDTSRHDVAAENPSQEDEIERQLREMLTNVDVIPLAAQSSGNNNMVDLLKSQVQLARPDHRLLLEMKIDDFESTRAEIEKNSSTQYDFVKFLTLLKDKFKARQPERLAKLSKISTYNTEFSQMGQLSKSLKKSIEVYQNVLKFYLVERWIGETDPLKNINDDLCTDCKNFCQFFRKTFEDWKVWLGQLNYGPQCTNLEILHNIVMREIPQERFLAKNPDFVQMDTKCHDGIIDKKDDLLRQNTFDFTSTFQENPKLLEAAQRQLKQAFDAPLPLVKLSYFAEALNTLVFVLTFEGHKEVGADQWLPMTILLLVLAAPERLPSTIKYIDHFVKSLMDDQSNEIRLISEQTEYTFTMVKSALMHFQRSIPGIGAVDEENFNS